MTSPAQKLNPANPEPDLSGPKMSWSRLLEIIGPTLALLGIFLFFYVLIGSSFATFYNLQTLLRQSTVTCMAALGATFIIISAGIDLSIGSAVALCAMVIAVLLNHVHHHLDPTTGITYFFSVIADDPATGGILADGKPFDADVF